MLGSNVWGFGVVSAPIRCSYQLSKNKSTNLLQSLEFMFSLFKNLLHGVQVLSSPEQVDNTVTTSAEQRLLGVIESWTWK